MTLKNRCKPRWKHQRTGEVIELPLLSNCLNSLIRQQQEDEHWEICISDWESADVPDVQEHLNTIVSKGKGTVDYKLITIDKPGFSRGYGLNTAFSLSSFDNIFFLDADMLFSGRQVIDFTYMHIKNGKVYFPVCISYRNIDHTSGWARSTGAGNVAMGRETFLTKPGGWMEKYTWGNEDGNMLKFFKPIKCRDITKTFFHQWHPTKMHIHLLNGHEWDQI